MKWANDMTTVETTCLKDKNAVTWCQRSNCPLVSKNTSLRDVTLFVAWRERAKFDRVCFNCNQSAFLRSLNTTKYLINHESLLVSTLEWLSASKPTGMSTCAPKTKLATRRSALVCPRPRAAILVSRRNAERVCQLDSDSTVYLSRANQTAENKVPTQIHIEVKPKNHSGTVQKPCR